MEEQNLPEDPDGPESSPGLDALQGWLILIPFVALAWPNAGGLFGGGLFAGAPDTESIGLGAIALAALPSVALATLRGRGGDLVGLPLLYIVLAFAAFQVQRVSDSFGAWRAMIGLAAAVGWTVAGASLGDHGRRVVARGLPLVTLLLLAATPFSPLWTGALGNTGDVSEAALPGAVMGAGAFLGGSGPIAIAGLVALVAFAAFAGLVPVYAGLLGVGAAVTVAGAATILGRAGGGDGRRAAARRFRLLLLSLLIGLAPVGVATFVDAEVDTGTTREIASQPRGERTTTGGIEFRRRTWDRVPALVIDNAQLGVGPGQFQAAFPPYRDPAEIEASSFGRAETTPIEVEHAHNDWLTILAEYGSVGGGAFVLFLILALVRAARAVAGDDETRRDFGLAAIAVLANAAVNSPLLYGPAAPLVAFVVLGVVLSAKARRIQRSPFDHIAPGLALAALLFLAPKALSYVQYGRVLAEIPSARIVLADGREKLDGVALASILDRAEAYRPDSPIVLEKRAELLRAGPAPIEEQRKTLGRWLELRPYSFAALLASGALEARAGVFDAARDQFVRALLLDPGHPGLLRNLVRLGCDRREPEEVIDGLDTLVATGHSNPAFVRALALEKMLEGRLDVARPLVARWSAESGEGPIDVLDANATTGAQKRAQKDGDDERMRAFRNAVRVRFGQDHVARGMPEQAVTQFRLAYQSGRDAGVDTGALRLHLAAAHAAAGQFGRAQEAVDEGPVRRADFLRLAETERQALTKAEILSGAASAEPR